MFSKPELNAEQLERLKAGVEDWNKWRKENPTVKIDLFRANLVHADLRGANLSGADLNGADLSYANLREADLRIAEFSYADLNGADLIGADLIGADLSYADLRDADFRQANLSGADLREAVLFGADLREADFREAALFGADLFGADLSGADLSGANLSGANLSGANLSKTKLYKAIINTNFGNADLTETLDLEEVKHKGPSTIGTDTLQLLKGHLPETFLRGCGLPDWEIESAKFYNPDLTNEEIVKIQYRIFDLRATQALQLSPLFISYSHADTDFVDHLDLSLTKKGVRFWRDIHDAKAGQLETQIDLAIRQNPTVLLVLSKNSIQSDWVEHEVRHARKLEKELGRDALCPIALDDAWKSSPWPERIMEQVMEYNILDFSGWENKSAFEAKFAKLLSGLEIFYKKPRE